MNERFQAVLRGQGTKTPPIWFMRQAGRYHSHYQGLRAKHSFMDLCKVPELAAEVALGPVVDFDFDVAILFSDLLFPLEALGMGLEYRDTGPELGWHLDGANLGKLRPFEAAREDLRFQGDALRATRDVLPKDKSLVGFVGGPWTLFVYACEGSHAGNLLKSKTLLPHFNSFLEHLLPLLEFNIGLQIEAGAEVVYLFDTAAGELSADLFNRLVAPPLASLANRFPGKLGYYSKGTQASYFPAGDGSLIGAPWAGLGFDHRWDLCELLRTKRHRGFVQGNFDQALLHADTDALKKFFDDYLRPFRELSPETRSNWICGLGHGVLPRTPEKHVRYLVDRVREVFR